MIRLIQSAMRTAAALAAVAALAGCATGGVKIAHPDAACPADEDSAAFLDRMSDQTHVTENDAMHGMLILLDDGRDHAKTFKQRVELLEARRIVDETWRHNAGRPLTRGKLAFMVYRATNFPARSITLSLFGASRRYCLRELRYNRMMGPGAEGSPVTGMEFTAVLDRAEIYRRTGQVPGRAGEPLGHD